MMQIDKDPGEEDPFSVEHLFLPETLEIPDLDSPLWDSIVTDAHLFEECNSNISNTLNENESNSGQSHEEMTCGLSYRLTPPDTPPSSDRSTPPIITDVTCTNQDINFSNAFNNNYNQLNTKSADIKNVSSLVFASHCPVLVPPMSNATVLLPATSSPTLTQSMQIVNPFTPSLQQHHHHHQQQQQQSQLVQIKEPLSPEQTQHCQQQMLWTPQVQNVPQQQPLQSQKTPAIKRRESTDKIQLSQMKKEARKIRNREAANQSRLKKQEQLETLTNRVNELTNENQKLKEENLNLKVQLESLYAENEILKQAISPSSMTSGTKKKATISVFAVLLMFGINFSSLLFNADSVGKSRLSISGSSNDLGYPGARTGGRSLLWATPSEMDPSFNRFDSDALPVKQVVGYVNSSSPGCRSMNQTELIRLKKEFQGWAQRVGREQAVPQPTVTQSKRSVKARTKKANVPDHGYALKGIKFWRNQQKVQDIYNRELNDLPVSYSDLMDAIDGREDTFYFISLSSIYHLYLPKKSNSTELRPRFSVLMPEIGNNSTGTTTNRTNLFSQQVFNGQMAMMQIDCEVINMNVKRVPIKNQKGTKSKDSSAKIVAKKSGPPVKN